MNKLFILCGMVFLGMTSTSQSPESNPLKSQEAIGPVTLKVYLDPDHGDLLKTISPGCEEYIRESDPDIASIAYEVIEEPVILGFDTAEFLPANFNPYRSDVDLNAIPYLEEGDDELAHAVVKGMLPERFDPYAPPADVMHISFMEEEEIDLGFDTRAWLPEGFDPYVKELDLNTVVYIEEDDLDLGFDPSLYLPENFDPYSL